MTDTYGPRDLIGYGADVPDAQWPGGAKIAISIVVNYEEGSELHPDNGDTKTEVGCNEMGPGLVPMKNQRDVNMEEIFNYGSRVGVWRLFRLFEEYKIKVTAYACGMALEKNPKVAPAFEEGHHEIASHGYRWVDRSPWGPEEEKDQIKLSIKAIKTMAPSGKGPVGWYWGHIESEGGARSRALVAQAFAEEGETLKYYSDDYSDDLPHYVKDPAGSDNGLLIVPYSLDNNYRFHGYQGFVSGQDYFTYLKGSFDELYREGVKGRPKMISLGLHCRTMGKPGRIGGLRSFIEYAQKHEGVWFATREEIADHWRKVHPYENFKKE